MHFVDVFGSTQGTQKHTEIINVLIMPAAGLFHARKCRSLVAGIVNVPAVRIAWKHPLPVTLRKVTGYFLYSILLLLSDQAFVSQKSFIFAI